MRPLPCSNSWTGEVWMDHFAPLCEASAHDFPVVGGGHQMATRTKERCDHSEGREKPLGVSGQLEAPHATFSFSRWLTGIFCAIVRSPVVDVRDIGQYLRLGGRI